MLRHEWSGVTALSFSDGSAYSGSEALELEPGSPYGSGSGSVAGEDARMAPAATVPWPWSRRDEAPQPPPLAPLKRSGLARRVDNRASPPKRPRPEPPPLAVKTVANHNNNSLTFDAAEARTNVESRCCLTAIAPVPSVRNVVESAKQISSIPKHVIRKPVSDRHTKRCEPTSGEPNSDGKLSSDMKLKPQQGRITEYFKSQMKPLNGLRKDINSWMDKGTYARRKLNSAKSVSEANENLEKYITYLSQTLNPKVLLNPSKVEKRAADSIGDNIHTNNMLNINKLDATRLECDKNDKSMSLLPHQHLNNRNKQRLGIKTTEMAKCKPRISDSRITNVNISSSKSNLKRVRTDKKKNSSKSISNDVQNLRKINPINVKPSNLVTSTVSGIANRVIKNHTHITTVNNIVTSTTQCAKIRISQENGSQSILKSINLISENSTSIERVTDSMEESCHMISSSTLAPLTGSNEELNTQNISVTTTNSSIPFLALPQATVMLTAIRLPSQSTISQHINASNQATYNRAQNNLSMSNPAKLNGQFVLPVIQNLNGTVVQIPNLIPKMNQNIVIPNNGSQLASQGSQLTSQHQMLLNGTLLKLNSNIHSQLTNLVTKTNNTNLSYNISPKNINSSVPVVVSKANFPVALNHPLFVPSSGFILNSVPNLITTQATPTGQGTESSTGSSIMFTNSPNFLQSVPSTVCTTMANITVTPCTVPLSPLKPTSYIPILPRKATSCSQGGTAMSEVSTHSNSAPEMLLSGQDSGTRKDVSSNSSSVVNNSDIHIEITPESLIEAVINSKFSINENSTDRINSKQITNSANNVFEVSDNSVSKDSEQPHETDIKRNFRTRTIKCRNTKDLSSITSETVARSLSCGQDDIVDSLSDNSSGIGSASSLCEQSNNSDLTDSLSDNSSGITSASSPLEQTSNDIADALSDNSSGIASCEQIIGDIGDNLCDNSSGTLLTLSPSRQSVEECITDSSGSVSLHKSDKHREIYGDDSISNLETSLTVSPCKSINVADHTDASFDNSSGIISSSLSETVVPKELDDDSPSSILTIQVNNIETSVVGQKSPILSQPKTIRFPAKQHHRNSESLDRCNSGDPSNNIKFCQWDHCTFEFEYSSELLEHLQDVHIGSQTSRETYVCLWAGCKVKGRASCSRLWLERHTLSHGGNKPFRCIVDQCGKRFNTQLLLQRHVNGHFSEQSPNVNNVKKTAEGSASKLLKKNGKKLRFRRQPWSARMFDFFDAGIMEGLQHRLSVWSGGGGCTAGPGFEHCLKLSCRVIARRTKQTPQATVEALVTYTPPNILENEWIPEQDVQSTKIVRIKDLPSSAKASLHDQFNTTHLDRRTAVPTASRLTECVDEPPKSVKPARRMNGVKSNSLLAFNQPSNGIKPHNGLKSRASLFQSREDQYVKDLSTPKSENETDTANVKPISSLSDRQCPSREGRARGAAKRKQGRVFGGYCFFPSGR